MVFLPKSVFNNVLSFCDDRIEQNQKILKKGVIATINILNQLRNLHSHNFSIYCFTMIDYKPINFITNLINYVVKTTSLLLVKNQIFTERYYSPFDSIQLPK